MVYVAPYDICRLQMVCVRQHCDRRCPGIGRHRASGTSAMPDAMGIHVDTLKYIQLYTGQTSYIVSKGISGYCLVRTIENDLNTFVSAVSRTVQKICRWCIENKLTISIEKAKFLLFHTSNKPLVKNLREIETEAMKIKRVDVVAYLGVTIDEKLTWNAHVENVCNSLLKLFGIFKQMRHKVTKNTVGQLYHAFIYFEIKYGLEVYANTSLKNISKVLVIQNKLLKYIMHLDIRTRTDFLHTSLNIMKVEDIHTNKVLNFVNMCRMGKCPTFLINIIRWNLHLV